MNKIRRLILYGIFAFALITIVIGKDRSLGDRFLGCILILGLLGIIRLLLQSILDVFDKKKKFHKVIVICITTSVILTFIYSVVEFTQPVVSSGLIELQYDLSISAKSYSVMTKNGVFKIEKIPNDVRYRIYFPRKIYKVENFVGESRLTKQRMSWVEYVDFETKEACIESKHELNLHVPTWQSGKFMISYKYKLNPIEYFKNPVKIFFERL